MIKTASELEAFDLHSGTPHQDVVGVDWRSKGLLYSLKTSSMRAEHKENFGGEIAFIVEVDTNYIVMERSGGVYWYPNGVLAGGCTLNMSSVDTFALSSNQQWLAVASTIDCNVALLQLPPKM